jgi:hypothetical protein
MNPDTCRGCGCPLDHPVACLVTVQACGNRAVEPVCGTSDGGCLGAVCRAAEQARRAGR